jgi:hypothetical protein
LMQVSSISIYPGWQVLQFDRAISKKTLVIKTSLSFIVSEIINIINDKQVKLKAKISNKKN